MPKKEFYRVFWSQNSLENSIVIKKYLQEKFTQREIDGFYSLLATFEEAVIVYPKLYPLSKKITNQASGFEQSAICLL